jgi:hypothetical protein
VEFQAIHGDTGDGFVAVDGIIFEAATECPFAPAQAWPQSTTTTMTTPVPTEPPDRKEELDNAHCIHTYIHTYIGS